jgi:hypothetical protein
MKLKKSWKSGTNSLSTNLLTDRNLERMTRKTSNFKKDVSKDFIAYM